MRYLAISLFIAILSACGAHHDPDRHDKGRQEAPSPARLEREATLTPLRMNDDSDWAQAVAGGDYLCGLKQAGSLWCAGNNDTLQFGEATEPVVREFLRIGEEYWASVQVTSRANEPFACGVTRGGKLSCWGYPAGMAETREPAKAQVYAAGWAQVTAGFHHVCGVTTAGKLACFGANDEAQLGIDGGAQTSPVIVNDAGTFVETSAGRAHSCGIQTDGALYCWGAPAQTGANGALTSSPTRISASATWALVAAGDMHTCAIRTNGSLWCWGNGESGQLGIGVTNDRWLIPVQVGDDTDWARVDVGTNHTCALKESGQLFCWGANEYGQLGNGSRLLKDKPAQVKSAYAWISLDINREQTCGVRSDGSLWCWGRTVHLR